MKYSDEELLNIIRNKAKELGRTPKRKEIRQFSVIRDRFGSWTNAVVKAGLKPIKIFGDKAHYIAIGKQFMKDCKKIPIMSDYDDSIYLPSTTAIRKKFGSWNKYLEECGFTLNVKRCENYNFTKEELILIVTCWAKNSDDLSAENFNKNRDENVPSTNFIVTRLDMTWSEIIKNLGYKNELTLFEMKQILFGLIEELGHTPSIKELEKYGHCSSMFKKKCGSYNKLLKELNFIPNKTPTKVTESKDELLQQYIDYSNKLGRAATTIDLDNSKKLYNSAVYITRFGNMKNLTMLAGFETRRRKPLYNKRDVNIVLKNLYEKYGRKLTLAELKKEKVVPSINTMMRLYQTTKFSEIWKEVLG